MTKYVFVTGGVVSSLGKGITAASLGVLLKRRGYRVSIIKMDPYINVDAGAMSPFQHGKFLLPGTERRQTLTLGIMSALSMRLLPEKTAAQPVKSIPL